MFPLISVSLSFPDTHGHWGDVRPIVSDERQALTIQESESWCLAPGDAFGRAAPDASASASFAARLMSPWRALARSCIIRRQCSISSMASEWSWLSHGRSVVNRSASTFPKRTEWRGLAAVGHVTSASSSTAVETSSRYPVRQPQTIRRSFIPVSLFPCAAKLARLPDSSKHQP